MATKAKTPEPDKETATGDANVEQTEAPDTALHAAQPTRLRQAEHVRLTWSHVADVGESFEQLLHPATFAHVSQQLKIGHVIEVHASDGTWFGELYVRSVGRNEVFTAPIRFIEFGQVTPTPNEAPYAISHRGPHMKWCVTSRETKAVIKDNFDTQEQAAAWVAQHLKAVAA